MKANANEAGPGPPGGSRPREWMFRCHIPGHLAGATTSLLMPVWTIPSPDGERPRVFTRYRSAGSWQ